MTTLIERLEAAMRRPRKPKHPHKEPKQKACTRTMRHPDCWEYGCDHHAGCFRTEKEGGE